MNVHDLERFVALTAKVRKAQKLYFETRIGLDECRKLERALDRLILQYRERLAGQATLFE